MNPALIKLGLIAMGSDGLEDVTFALVLVDHPSARRLRAPDGGRDTVVPATEDAGEHAFQAKHHTDGISWSKCRKSVEDAMARPEPPEVITFVFPVNLTAKDEENFGNLKEGFPTVTFEEPWGLSRLRELLDRSPDVRREHIEAMFPVDQGYAQRMLERGAALREGWDAQLSAALAGPLVLLGHDKTAAEAEAAAERGDHKAAADAYQEIAERLKDRMPAVADWLLIRAARAAGDDGDKRRAGALHLKASRSAARRGDSLAEYAAFRASWELPEAERWRSFAAMARAAWPEEPDEAIATLRDAVAHAVAAGNTEAVSEWTTACCEALALQGRWDEVRTLASEARELAGATIADEVQLELELDLLDARAALREDVDEDYNRLLLTPFGREDSVAARVRARWGVVCARRGDHDAAQVHFRDAASRWRNAGDSEDEIAEALFSEDATVQVLAGEPQLDQPGRIAVAELRGRTTTPAVLAERLVAQGLRAWLAKQGWEARRCLVIAWTLHRKAGHLAGCLRVADNLADLHASAEDPAERLRWAIRCGKQLAAREASESLVWDEVHSRLALTGAPWERGASYEAIAAAGSTAPQADVDALADGLLDAGADHSGDERRAVIPAAAARRALATVLCAIDRARFRQARDEVVYETRHTPFPPRHTMSGLLLAEQIGLLDEAPLIADVFCFYDRMHVPGFDAALGVIRESDQAVQVVVKDAAKHFTPLLLAAWLDLPDTHPELATRASDLIARADTGNLGPEEHLRLDDKGRLGRWATRAQQQQLAAELATEVANYGDLDAHRHEAAVGLESLAERLEADDAAHTLDALLARADDIGTESQVDGMQSHPNAFFARVRMNTPPAGDLVGAKALEATCALAARAGRLAGLADDIHAAVEGPEPALRLAAVKLLVRYSELPDLDLRALLTGDDPDLTAVVLAALDQAGELALDDPALVAAAAPEQPLHLRAAALGIAEHHPSKLSKLLAQLGDDPHVFVRAFARKLAAKG